MGTCLYGSHIPSIRILGSPNNPRIEKLSVLTYILYERIFNFYILIFILIIVPQISIIVPVYNSEKCLRSCLNSILAQTFTDWETILVDDGSKDKSGILCDEYAEKDSRIKCIHKPNGGVSSARNLGLDNANGEFITFLDSDDYIGQEYLAAFASKPQYDLIFTGIHRVGSVDYCMFGDEELVFPTAESLVDAMKVFAKEKNLTLGGLSFVACKAMRRSIVEECNIRFNENMIYGEDAMFVYEFIQNMNNAIQVKGNEYYYDTPSSPHVFRFTPDSYWEHCITYKKVFSKMGERFHSDFGGSSNSYCVSAFIQFFRNYSRSDLKTKRAFSKDYFKLKDDNMFQLLVSEKGILKASISFIALRHPIMGHYIFSRIFK